MEHKILGSYQDKACEACGENTYHLTYTQLPWRERNIFRDNRRYYSRCEKCGETEELKEHEVKAILKENLPKVRRRLIWKRTIGPMLYGLVIVLLLAHLVFINMYGQVDMVKAHFIEVKDAIGTEDGYYLVFDEEERYIARFRVKHGRKRGEELRFVISDFFTTQCAGEFTEVMNIDEIIHNRFANTKEDAATVLDKNDVVVQVYDLDRDTFIQIEGVRDLSGIEYLEDGAIYPWYSYDKDEAELQGTKLYRWNDTHAIEVWMEENGVLSVDVKSLTPSGKGYTHMAHYEVDGCLEIDSTASVDEIMAVIEEGSLQPTYEEHYTLYKDTSIPEEKTVVTYEDDHVIHKTYHYDIKEVDGYYVCYEVLVDET